MYYYLNRCCSLFLLLLFERLEFRFYSGFLLLLLSERYFLFESLELTINLFAELRVELQVFLIGRELFNLFYFVYDCLQSRRPLRGVEGWLLLLLALFLLFLLVLLLLWVYHFHFWVLTLRIVRQHLQRVVRVDIPAHLASELLGMLDVLGLNLVLNGYIG